MRPRIVITGTGVTSALGMSRQALFEALLRGESAIRTRPDWEDHITGAATVLAAPVEIPPERAKAISRHSRRSMGPTALFAALAARALAEDAALTPEELASGRTGCIVSSTLGSASEICNSATALVQGCLNDLSACEFFKIASHSAAFNVANLLGIRGVLLSPCSACASSLQSVGLAYEQLLLGRQEAFVAGGCDEVAPVVLDFFRLLHALADAPDLAPEQQSRPFDARRCGLVVGEGAGLLSIETLAHAQARGAKPLAEIAGYATNCTGTQISQSDRASIVRCMQAALDDAGLAPADIDYVSAHATSTPAGDREEAAAIRELFGDRVPVSSLKGQLGHTMGASGALETAAVLEMMAHNLLLPNANLENVDDECAGLWLLREPLERPVKAVMKNCIAFGGVNATLILKRLP